jgi:hypothetical protein
MAPLSADAEPPPGVGVEDARSSRYDCKGFSRYTDFYFLFRKIVIEETGEVIALHDCSL